MTTFPAMVSLLLLAAVVLGAVSLSLSLRVRRQQQYIHHLSEGLAQARREGEEHRQRLVDQASQDSSKNEFIANVSHELRTPLTSIRGALGLLSAGLLGNVDAKAYKLLRIASSNTERLIRLINDILDLERMDSGATPLNLRRVSIQDLSREAVETMTSMADNAQVHLTLECLAPRDSIYFDADSDRVLQVITNLLSNAIKFSPASSTVSVIIDAHQDTLLLRVIDRGRGIPADKLESIFDRFQQVESSDSTRKGGTGLGLAICRSIVEQHSGAIWAQPNADGPGTTLWVQFSRSGRASDPEISSSWLLESPVQRGSGFILVCDDDSSIRIVVAEQLRRHGYDIMESGTGEETLEIAAKSMAHLNGTTPQRISAILLDLNMQGMSGWETLKRLKQSTVTRTIPVVILSVVPAAEKPHRAAEAQGWVQKPFNENLLLAELHRVLNKANPTQLAASSASSPDPVPTQSIPAQNIAHPTSSPVA